MQPNALYNTSLTMSTPETGKQRLEKGSIKISILPNIPVADMKQEHNVIYV